MKAKALYTILSAKYKKGQVLFVDDLSLRVIKTKTAKDTLGALSKIKGFGDLSSRKKNSAYIALSNKDITTEKSFGNFNNLKIDEIRNLSPLDLMKYKYVIISNPSIGLEMIVNKLKVESKK